MLLKFFEGDLDELKKSDFESIGVGCAGRIVLGRNLFYQNTDFSRGAIFGIRHGRYSYSARHTAFGAAGRRGNTAGRLSYPGFFLRGRRHHRLLHAFYSIERYGACNGSDK